VKEGVEIFWPQDYPVFLYEDDYVDPDNLLSGFMRSQLLVRVCDFLPAGTLMHMIILPRI
jgi:Family of unknown function (DUF6698)